MLHCRQSHAVLHIGLIRRCSSGCNLDEYPANMLVADGINVKMLNTQVAEQVKSLLESIRTQVSKCASVGN